MKRPYRAPNKPNLPFVDWVLSVPLRLNRPTSDRLETRSSALSTDRNPGYFMECTGHLASLAFCMKSDNNQTIISYCYTAIHFSGDTILLAYNFGGVGGGVLQDLCIRKLTLEYLYSNDPT